ncbi:MAG: T9SS type A sorting domain-containing protein [Prevotellaceae bacterium]|jgi:hypothetical protein|nr:T9SS type A sorting domain-containing protein [Prevotellaceae bacterium]
MKRNYLKRFIAAGAFMMLAFAGAAQTEICQWAWEPVFTTNYSGIDATTHEGWCEFTWATVPSGNVEITIAVHPDHITNPPTVGGVVCNNGQFRGSSGMANNGFTLSSGLFADYFDKSISADRYKVILTPKQEIPAGTKIFFRGQVEYKTSTTTNPADNGNNLYPVINMTGAATTQNGFTYTPPAPDGYTYGTDCNGAVTIIQLAPALNVAITESTLTFDPVTDATSYTAFVYLGTLLVSEQPVEPTGTALTWSTPGEYTVTVKASGAGTPSLSTPVSWIIAGEPPVLPASNYCWYYYSNGAQNSCVLSFETLENGSIQITINEVDGNGAAWRDGALAAAKWIVGTGTVANGANYLTSSWTGNVLTIVPKDGVVIPHGYTLKYNQSMEYATIYNTDLWPTPNFTYIYGSDCSSITREVLATPENVVIDETSHITFDPVAHAGSYTAFVYNGTTLLYRQTVASSEVLNFTLPGTYDVKVQANAASNEMNQYQESELSDAYSWEVVFSAPSTIPQSVLCEYEVDVNTNNASGNINDDRDASIWSWETDLEGRIIVTILRAKYPVITEDNTLPYFPADAPAVETATEVAFREQGMPISNFTVNGIPALTLLEKVTEDVAPNQQIFKAKPGVNLVPGLVINYAASAYTTYRVLPLGSLSALDDLYPAIAFSNYIYGSVCAGEVSVLAPPTNLTVTEDGAVITFDAVTGAASYLLLIYNAAGELVGTEPVVSGGSITYENPGRFTVAVKSIGDGTTTISSVEESARANWVKYAQLATPSVKKINTFNELFINTVPSAISYTVTVYAAADANTAVVTETDYVDGSVVPMDQLAYGEYTVKVQAIGDGDVITDSELSAAYAWTYAEPYDCNLFLQTEPKDHTLVKGDGTFTWTKNDGTTTTGDPYFAPGWVASTDFTFDVNGTTANIHLGVATGGDWQAQFRIFPIVKITNKQNGFYDISLKVTTNKSTPVYIKIFEYNDDAFITFDECLNNARVAVDGEKVFTLQQTPLNSNLYQILFDFGGNAAGTDITISDISICGEEGDDVAINLVNENKITVYPNPTADMLYISNTSAKEAKIISILGNVIPVQVQNGAINVAGLANGIYFLNIDNQTVKFIKK